MGIVLLVIPIDAEDMDFVFYLEALETQLNHFRPDRSLLVQFCAADTTLKPDPIRMTQMNDLLKRFTKAEIFPEIITSKDLCNVARTTNASLVFIPYDSAESSWLSRMFWRENDECLVKNILSLGCDVLTISPTLRTESTNTIMVLVDYPPSEVRGNVSQLLKLAFSSAAPNDTVMIGVVSWMPKPDKKSGAIKNFQDQFDATALRQKEGADALGMDIVETLRKAIPPNRSVKHCVFTVEDSDVEGIMPKIMQDHTPRLIVLSENLHRYTSFPTLDRFLSVTTRVPYERLVSLAMVYAAPVLLAHRE